MAAGVAVAAGGCGDGGEESSSAGGGPTEQVTFVTTFGNQGRDAYAFVAADKGFFAEVGIEVKVEPGKAGDYNHQLLAAGTAQFAAVDSAGAFIRYATGRDTSFQVLAAVHQSTVVGILALQDGPVAGVKELEGKTLGTIKGAVPETLFAAYAKQAGFEASTVRWRYASDPAGLNTLLAAGVIDGAGLFVVGVPGVEAAAAKAGKPRRAIVLPYGDYLTSLYGAVVVTQKATIADNPDLAKRFTQGLLKGLAYAVNNPQEAGKILARRVGQDPAVAAAELERMKTYVLSGRTAVGALDKAKVARMVASLEGHGLIPGGTGNPQLPDRIVRFDLAPEAV